MVLGPLCVLVSSAEKGRPNIILLFADDQRPDSIGAFGNPHIETPNLDRLASQGFRFGRNYCAGSYSGAVCVASRTMLMTGRHWMRVEDRRNWSGLPLLPEVLAQSGYKTFITGKWHNGQTSLKRAFQQGRNVFMGGMADHTKVPVSDLTTEGELVKQRTPKGFSSELFADAAVQFLEEEQESKDPFFLYVAFTAPHDPRNPPEAYREKYYRKRPPLPENYMPQHPFDNGFVRGVGRDESLAPWPRTKETISDQLCEYYGLITHLDEQVGRIVKAMEALPDANNTYLVYTADHGLAMGSHGLLGKQNIYEHSVQSPFIVRGPGVPRGGQTTALTYIHDLYATFCGLAGRGVPEGVDSEDLAPLWRGDKKSLRDSAFLPFQQSMRAITDGRWKLHRYPHSNHTLLFDLEEDPHELKNLAMHPQYANQVERLMEEMRQWQSRLGDTQSLTVDNPKSLDVDYSTFKRKLDRWQPDWIREKYFGGRSDPDHGK
jgi:arylsulfatase A-like enzyme